jgi:hypothetical protein
MRRLEQNGGILIRALLISGIVIVMTMIVGTHTVIGSTDPQTISGEGKKAGAADCTGVKSYNTSQNPYRLDPPDAPYWLTGYTLGWEDAGCTHPDKK